MTENTQKGIQIIMGAAILKTTHNAPLNIIIRQNILFSFNNVQLR